MFEDIFGRGQGEEGMEIVSAREPGAAGLVGAIRPPLRQPCALEPLFLIAAVVEDNAWNSSFVTSLGLPACGVSTQYLLTGRDNDLGRGSFAGFSRERFCQFGKALQ